MLWAGSASAAPATLELAQVDTFLRTAGVTAPWSVQQHHFARAPNVWTISAMTDRKPVGENLCSSRLVEIDLTDNGGRMAIDSTSDRVEYAFTPCEWSSPDDYHEIRGGFDPERLERDYETIVSAIRGRASKDVKVAFAQKLYRAAFATLRRTDIHDIDADEDGHLRICFLSDLVDQLGAPEILSVDVIPGTPTEVKVGLCGVIDIVPAKK